MTGEVLLDGENIRSLQVEWLRSQIGLVSQEPALFNGTVTENILYGRGATMDEVEEAAKIAHAHTFISSLPNGYDSEVMDSRPKFSLVRLTIYTPCNHRDLYIMSNVCTYLSVSSLSANPF